jgi:hypothetical protein
VEINVIEVVDTTVTEKLKAVFEKLNTQRDKKYPAFLQPKCVPEARELVCAERVVSPPLRHSIIL